MNLSPIDRLKCALPNLLPVAGLFLVVFGVVGMIFVQHPLQESQDPRSEAAVDQGYVEIDSISNTSREYQVEEGEAVTFELGISTEDLRQRDFSGIGTIDLVFNVITDTANSLEVIPKLQGFSEESTEVEVTDDGFLVATSLVANTDTLNVQFPRLTRILSISLIPERSGTLEINFDREHSVVRAADSDADILTMPDSITYQIGFVEGEATPTPTPSPTPTPTPTPKPDNDDQDSSVVSCNESCSTNADCPVSHRCFATTDGKRCRLATNPSNTSCQAASKNTTQTISTTNRQCNQSCQRNSECATGLSCVSGRCRNPANATNTSCAQLTQAETAAQVASCNESCSTNNDCAVNFRCYNGDCRLATNPSSSSCTPATQKTVSQLYEGKGGDTSDQSGTGNPALPDDSTDSANAEQPTNPTTDGQPDDTDRYNQEQTALDTLLNLLRDQRFSLPLLVLLGGIALLLLSLLIHLIRSVVNSRRQPPGSDSAASKVKPEPSVVSAPKTGAATTATSQKPLEYPVKPQQGLSVRPQTTVEHHPVSAAPSVEKEIDKSTDDSAKNNASEDSQDSNTAAEKPTRSAMLERMKHKQITPPGSTKKTDN